LDGEGLTAPPARPSTTDSTYGHHPTNGGHLQRTQTGMSSIVGANNGERPGGFVLVIDGAALDFVCGYEFISFFLPKTLLLGLFR
jgi:phospholipid-translocating ATPase